MRSTRSIKVSAFGLQFYEKARTTLSLIDEIFAPRINDNLPVRITAPAVICRLFVMPLIEKISAVNPEIHFDVRPSDAISDVVESQINIGIRVGSQLTSNRSIGRSLAKIRHVIVATITDPGESEFSAVQAGLGFGQLAIFMAAPYIRSGELDLFLYRPQSGPVPHRTRLVYDAFVWH